jgi:hypothetical protein
MSSFVLVLPSGLSCSSDGLESFSFRCSVPVDPGSYLPNHSSVRRSSNYTCCKAFSNWLMGILGITHYTQISFFVASSPFLVCPSALSWFLNALQMLDIASMTLFFMTIDCQYFGIDDPSYLGYNQEFPEQCKSSQSWSYLEVKIISHLSTSVRKKMTYGPWHIP